MTSSGQSSRAANVMMISDDTGSAVPAAPGSFPKPICQSRGGAMFRSWTTRTASSTSSGGVPSATRNERWVSREAQQETVGEKLLVGTRLGAGGDMGERILVEIGEQFGARHRVGELSMVDRTDPWRTVRGSASVRGAAAAPTCRIPPRC